VNNLAAYLYGTELPDNGGSPDGIGDTTKHHIYYNSAEVMTDDAAAVRASTEYSNTLSYLEAKDYEKAAKDAGIMSHYIVDVAVFGHVMGSGTDWGAEVHHSDYETYVNGRTSSYSAEFNSYLSFDGSLITISAYDAASDLAYDTTFDVDGDLTCVWMDQNYDWSNSTFKSRAGESLNLAVNYLTDVLYTLYLEAASADSSPPSTVHDYDGSWRITDFIVTLTATDDLSGVNQTYYKINDGTTKTVSADEQPLLATEGDNNKLEYWSVDNAGNEENHHILTGIKLDKTSPTGSILINNGDANTTTLTVFMNLSASDATSGVSQMRFSKDGTTWTTWEAYTTSKSWTLSKGEGTKTVYVQYKDNVGLVSPTYHDTITLLDATNPITTISLSGVKGNNDWFTSNVAVNFSATDDISGVDKTGYSFNNATWTTYAAPFTITNEGNTLIYYRSMDKTGNVENIKTEVIKIDKPAPTMTITSPSPSYEIKSSNVSVTWTGSDEFSGISHYEIRLDGGSWTSVGTNTTYTFTGLSDGSHMVDIKAADKAGNTNQDTVNFIINTSPLFGPGYIEEIAITASIILLALGITLYLFKIKKH
jgi:hypothetical protein